MKKIRNFSIIAHIDHGKSTLSDRFIQMCGGLSEREMSDQVLDSMELEKERGITIKSRSVTIKYINKKKKKYKFNFIDTPGHVNFSYEVSRSLAACEGALLIIDSTQGIEAQTLANCYLALDMNLKIIPVLNKIDLPTSNIKKVSQEIEDIIGISSKDTIYCSAKTGKGVKNLLEKIIKKIPHPKGNIKNPLQALIIDSWFDNYIGVISLIRIKNGFIKKNFKIQIMTNKKIFNVEKIGIFTPKKKNKKILSCGEIGWISCGIKNISYIPIGDTITLYKNPSKESLPGFKIIKPKIFSGIFPDNANKYELLKKALEKLKLNDASIFYEPEKSLILGHGFRCGFLGLLHMEIIQERLKREYNLNLISTMPTVMYKIILKNKKIIYLDNPCKFPNINFIKKIKEPIALCNIIVNRNYLGNIITLCSKKRGIQKNLIYYKNQVSLIYEIPMSEVILNFFDELKSLSSGYASLDYNFLKFKKSDIIKLNILINSKNIDSLSILIHKKKSQKYANDIIKKMSLLIPRHQFNIVIQASIGKKIISRRNISQLRKNVLSKCYGGDISRKKKLLKKQKIGKKKMKKIGNINISKKIFHILLNKNN
ncbi:translation elongation factor 4 [Buchnera aphidicola]|uniref:translation elongation factor 4 n=1 Tax=Buchnera aphidicola TaxID=9 RepID=UPI0031B7F157